MNASVWIRYLAGMDCPSYDLPWPPSVNKYWRRTRSGVYLSRDAKLFRKSVEAEVVLQAIPRFTHPVVAALEMRPPRKSDNDNFEKALWDALQHSGVLVDDCQVTCVLRCWHPQRHSAGITLSITEVTGDALDYVPKWCDQTETGRKEQTDGKKKTGIRIRRR